MIYNEVNGHAHLSYLKMCPMISDPFPFIFDYGNVRHEMWWHFPLMPVVMKFCPTHKGMLCEQSCDIESQWEKGSRRSIMGRCHTDHGLRSCESFTQHVLSHMRPFLLGIVFPSVAFLHSK